MFSCFFTVFTAASSPTLPRVSEGKCLRPTRKFFENKKQISFFAFCAPLEEGNICFILSGASFPHLEKEKANVSKFFRLHSRDCFSIVPRGFSSSRNTYFYSFSFTPMLYFTSMPDFSFMLPFTSTPRSHRV